MQPQDYHIKDLIPQRTPMVMIDRLLSATTDTAIGELTVRVDNLFVREGYLQEAGLVEFMAQTAAAYTGYRNLQGNQKVREGYIGAIRDLTVHDLPPVQAILLAEVKIENEIVGYTIISAKVIMEDSVLASCEMRILTAA